MKKIASILLTLAAGTALALAADEPQQPSQGGDKPGGPEGRRGRPRPNPEELFKKLDANADGKLSEEEFLASPRAQKDPEKAREHFAKMDKDSDGSVSLDEFKAARPPRGPRGPGGPGGPGGPEGPNHPAGEEGAPPPPSPAPEGAPAQD